MATKKGAAKKGATKKGAGRGAGKRTTISPRGDDRYIRRNAKGQITESDDRGNRRRRTGG